MFSAESTPTADDLADIFSALMVDQVQRLRRHLSQLDSKQAIPSDANNTHPDPVFDIFVPDPTTELTLVTATLAPYPSIPYLGTSSVLEPNQPVPVAAPSPALSVTAVSGWTHPNGRTRNVPSLPQPLLVTCQPQAGRKWYVIFSGIRPGLYNSWSAVAPLVNGVSSNSHQSYPRGQYILVKNDWIGCTTDTPPCINSSAPLHEYYVVIRGESLGVYQSWAQASWLVIGLPTSKYEVYRSSDAATRAFERARHAGLVQPFCFSELSQYEHAPGLQIQKYIAKVCSAAHLRLILGILGNTPVYERVQVLS
ncbi:hypothetical protein OE88DRAFT_1643868 [Heliocybe sulcata]|uniref:Ribonuclease H1 N-terminal domain-containing protein n=1 Tax=Heliocybe sulcata TaxID=5364 RepID=A0A5C3N7I9_9AGAM|nr:hypothetical protein OE88DRAFT_1643868 [Heliocybe sulcata]